MSLPRLLHGALFVGFGAEDSTSRAARSRTGLRGLPPWLREPKDLDEAYGKNRKKSPAAKGPKTVPKPVVVSETFDMQSSGETEPRSQSHPALQTPLRERLKNVEPYQDVVRQIDQQCHGLKKWRVARTRVYESIKFKRPLRPSQKGTEKLEDKIRALATSSCHRYCRAVLTATSQFPKPDARYPEIAFIGRSNVGKSTLLNKISRFGTVASMSDLPGRTKDVAWYRNRKVGIDFIDMPGYGFAARARVFGPDTLAFVKERKSLACVYVLIDARHGFKTADHEWLTELGREGPMKQIVLTKTDLVPQRQLIQMASLVRADIETHKRVQRKLLMVSAVYGQGLYELRSDIIQRCGKDKYFKRHSDEPETSPLNYDALPIRRGPTQLGSYTANGEAQEIFDSGGGDGDQEYEDDGEYEDDEDNGEWSAPPARLQRR